MKQNFKGIADYGAIDLANAVDWDHPLNKGRLCWFWQPTGGLYFPDLCNTAVSPGLPAVTAVQSQTNPWGQFALNASNANLYYQANAPAKLLSLPTVTIGCTYVGTSAASSNNTPLFGVSYTNSATGSIQNYAIEINTTSIGGFWSIGGTGFTYLYPTTIVLGKPIRVVMVCTSTLVSIYANGVLAGARNDLPYVPPAVASAQLFLGSFTPYNTRLVKGLLNDCFINNIAWTPAMVAQDYQLAQNSYRSPDSPLRYVSTRSYFVGGFATVTGSAALSQQLESLSSTATITIPGSAALSQQQEQVSATGAITVPGSAALGQQLEKASGTATISISASAALYEQQYSLAGVAVVSVKGYAALSEQPNSMLSVTSVPVGAVSGTLTISPKVTGTFTVQPKVTGSLSLRPT